jgi:hypothetical protein
MSFSRGLMDKGYGRCYLKRKRNREVLIESCCNMDITVLDLFNKFGWRNANRIEA